MSKPTLKQAVHYFPTASDPALCWLDVPVSAYVDHIWSDTCVNLTIDDPRLPEDAVCLRTSVLYSPTANCSGNYCTPADTIKPVEISQVLTSDDVIETEIKAKGLTQPPRISKYQIDDMMARVVYVVVVPEGTTSTFCHAFLDGKFHLGTGHSACVSAQNFNAETGAKIAKGKAEQIARDKLWELEGYALFKHVSEPSAQATLTEQRLEVFIDMATLNLPDNEATEKAFAPLLEADRPDRETLLRCVDAIIESRKAPAPTQHTEDPDHGEG